MACNGTQRPKAVGSHVPSRGRHGTDDVHYREGGWGYVVVLAAFLALMIEMGLIVSMGVYLEHLEAEFESGASLGGWIASGCFAVLAFVSPLAGHFMTRFGCRPTAMIGGAVMCSGFVLASWATSVTQLFVFADVIGGVGASMSHISTTVVIGEYFNKRYALANGFAYMGQGVGIFIFPPILQLMIGCYGWRGCMFVQGAISLHIVAAAAMFRPVTPRRVKERPVQRRSNCGFQLKGVPTEDVTPSTTCRRGLFTVRDTDAVLDRSRCSLLDQTDLELTSSSSSTSSTEPSLPSPQPVKTPSCPHKPDVEVLTDGHRWRVDRFEGWKLLSESPAILFVFAIFLCETFGYGGFFSHIVSRTHEISGVSEHRAAFSLSLFGIGSLTGRSTHGWITYSGIFTAKTLNTLSLIMSAAASAMVAYIDNTTGVWVAVFLAGMGSGWFMPLQQVLMRDIVGQKRLHLAYGYGLVFEGIGSLAGGYVIGLLRDVTKGYSMGFYFLGFVFLLGAAIFPLNRACERRCQCANSPTGTQEEQEPKVKCSTPV